MASRKRPSQTDPSSADPGASSLQPSTGRPAANSDSSAELPASSPDVAFIQQNHLQIFNVSRSVEELRVHEQLVPGSADRILRLQEKELDLLEAQVNHRIDLEQTVIRGDNSRANWGLVSAFVIAMTGIGTSGFLIMHGHDIAGSVLGGTTFVSLVGTFIYGTNSRKQERQHKTEIMAQHQSETSRPKKR